MEKQKYYTQQELLDRIYGKPGTPERDEYEAGLKSFLMGEAIKQARLSKHMTQDQLGALIGVKRSRISKIEKGTNLTVSTISRAFKAMGIHASFEVQGVGSVAMW